MSRALFRDCAQEHPELESRIDRYIIAMTRFGILISLLFWPLIAVLGYVIQFSTVGLVIILIALLGFSNSLFLLNASARFRIELTLFFYLVFPATIAFYVSAAFRKIVDGRQEYAVLKDGVQCLQLTQEQFLQYVVQRFWL
jgi:hypothetical protein